MITFEYFSAVLYETPPQNRIELYMLAKMAQDIDLGFVSQARSLPLPEGL